MRLLKIKPAVGKFKNNRKVLDFAMVKALRIATRARELMKEVIAKNGYNNSDFDGYAYQESSFITQ